MAVLAGVFVTAGCDAHARIGPGRCEAGPGVAEFPAGFGHKTAVLSVTSARNELVKMEG